MFSQVFVCPGGRVSVWGWGLSPGVSVRETPCMVEQAVLILLECILVFMKIWPNNRLESHSRKSWIRSCSYFYLEMVVCDLNFGL